PQNAFWAFGFALFFLPCPPQLTTDAYSIYPLDGPGWSLFFELFINVVFALLVRRLSVRVLAAILSLSGVALGISAFVFGKLDLGWSWDNFVGGFPRVAYGFFAGVLIYRLRDHVRLALPPFVGFAALLILFMIPTPPAWRWLYDLAAATLFFPILVAVSAGSRVRGVLGYASATAGALSYGIYILHVPIWDWLKTGMPVVYVGWDALPASVHYAIVAVVAIIAAALLDAVYDTPVRRWLSRRRLKPAQA